MNLAKKSTSKHLRVNGISEIKSNDAILIDEDDANGKLSESSELSIKHVDNVDDVIICNVELPNHAISNTSVSSLENKTSDSINGSLKRTLDLADHDVNKKIKTSPALPTVSFPLGSHIPKMIILTQENLNSLIKEALKDELVNYQREAFNQYNTEIRELRIALEHWRQTAQKLHNEIAELKSKKLSETVAQNKDLPCNLPPASANPVTSQHLKIIHNSGLGMTQPLRNAVQVSPQLVSRISASNLQNPPLVIQPKTVPEQKKSSVIDLTSEDESLKTKSNTHSIQPVSMSLSSSSSSREPRVSESNESSVKVPNLYVNLNIPPPPLPPANQSAPPHAKDLPPKPIVNLTNDNDGVHLTWDCVLNPSCEEAVSYHLFSYQSVKEFPNKFLWKKVGNMLAMPLPMVCSLVKSKLDRQAAFAIRGVDRHCRLGLFSDVVVLNREIIS